MEIFYKYEVDPEPDTVKPGDVEAIMLQPGDNIILGFLNTADAIVSQPTFFRLSNDGERIKLFFHSEDRCETGRCQKPVVDKKLVETKKVEARPDAAVDALAAFLSGLFKQPPVPPKKD